jgi:DNA mismatch endonuclease, patch repair protein
MQTQARRDTRPELALRRALHARGLRYRLDVAIVPGTRRRVDIAFSTNKVAVFVDGCFWHRCPTHATSPVENADWWAVKLDGNVTRDRDTDARLGSAGWTVLRVWEHEDMAAAAERIATTVRPGRATNGGRE